MPSYSWDDPKVILGLAVIILIPIIIVWSCFWCCFSLAKKRRIKKRREVFTQTQHPDDSHRRQASQGWSPNPAVDLKAQPGWNPAFEHQYEERRSPRVHHVTIQRVE